MAWIRRHVSCTQEALFQASSGSLPGSLENLTIAIFFKKRIAVSQKAPFSYICVAPYDKTSKLLATHLISFRIARYFREHVPVFTLLLASISVIIPLFVTRPFLVLRKWTLLEIWYQEIFSILSVTHKHSNLFCKKKTVTKKGDRIVIILTLYKLCIAPF